MGKAIFLDRDGVINVDKGYVHKIEDFEFTKGAIKALRHFQNLGYELIIVTNQSGIGRGYYTQKDFEKLTNWMIERLKKEGIKIKEVYFCPHSPEEKCSCRKPEPGMILKAAKYFDIDLKNSWMIGDKISDIEAALKSGIKNTILIDSSDKNNGIAKYKAKSLLDTIFIVGE